MEFTINILLEIYLFAIFMDFILGISASYKEKKLKSRVCSNGLWRTFGEAMVLLMIYFVSLVIPQLSDYTNMFTILVLVKEALSISENLKRLGVWIPPKFAEALEVIRSNGDVK